MRVVVFVCADEPEIRYEGADTVAIDGLCKSPSELAKRLGEDDRAVLLLHPSSYDLADAQKALRSRDVDPLGAQFFDVPVGIADDDLEIAVTGLRQRALAFAGSAPEHAKPVPRDGVTRRGLFRVPQPVYLAAPLVDGGACAAADGCRVCVTVCPQDAYRWQQGRIHFNKAACEPCGRCVSACPTGAISNPAATPAMLAGQIRAVIGDGAVPVGIRFVCSRARFAEPVRGWQDVAVPCTGMVPGTWMTTALLMGAAAVTALECAAGGCPLNLDEHSRTAIDFARSALAAASLDAELVPVEPSAELARTGIPPHEFVAPFTHAGNTETMLALDSRTDELVRVTHPGAGKGIVTIDAAACTLCAQCAQTCPTDAIAAVYEGSSITLSFDAASCTNCGQCTIACPEIEQGAIGVTGRVDADVIRSGRRTLNEGVVLVCESCAHPIAPSSMMDRIGELLGDEFDDTMTYLSRRCIDCRGLT